MQNSQINIIQILTVTVEARMQLIPWHHLMTVLSQTVVWFSNTTGTSVDNGARSKNTRKELGRLRRRVLTELWFSKEVRGDCPYSGTIYSLFFHYSEGVDW